MYMHAHLAPVDHGILWTGVAMEAAFFVWADGWAALAFVRQDARAAD